MQITVIGMSVCLLFICPLGYLRNHTAICMLTVAVALYSLGIYYVFAVLWLKSFFDDWPYGMSCVILRGVRITMAITSASIPTSFAQ